MEKVNTVCITPLRSTHPLFLDFWKNVCDGLTSNGFGLTKDAGLEDIERTLSVSLLSAIIVPSPSLLGWYDTLSKSRDIDSVVGTCLARTIPLVLVSEVAPVASVKWGESFNKKRVPYFMKTIDGLTPEEIVRFVVNSQKG